jgi:hypothetical protein
MGWWMKGVTRVSLIGMETASRNAMTVMIMIGSFTRELSNCVMGRIMTVMGWWMKGAVCAIMTWTGIRILIAMIVMILTPPCTPGLLRSVMGKTMIVMVSLTRDRGVTTWRSGWIRHAMDSIPRAS